MNVKNRLKNSVIRKIQQLSTDKLTEVNDLLNKIDRQIKSKDETLKLAGTWKDLDDHFFVEMTDKLHDSRAMDRRNNAL